MRLLQIDAGDGTAIDLHPYVSVVRGLAPDLRDRVLETVAALPRGEAPSVRGLVEAHGVFLDLLPSTLALLDLNSAELDVVVRAKDLPGSAMSPAARQLRARQQVRDDLVLRLEETRRAADAAAHDLVAAEESADRARRALDEAVATVGTRLGNLDQVTQRIDELDERGRQLERELADARASIEALHARRAEVEVSSEPVRSARREAAEACSRIAALLEEARGGRDPDAAAAVEAAREHLAAVEAQNEAERRAEIDTPDEEVLDAPSDRADRLAERMDELRGLIGALDSHDRIPVEDPLGLLKNLDQLDQVPSPEAFALADEIDAIEQRLRSSDDGQAADGERIAAARQRLDRARAALLEAEQSIRLPELDRADVDQLEHAHADLLQAQDKADSRFGGARADRRVAEAREAEQAILDRLGFTTYSDFMMGTSMLHVDSEREGVLDRARTELSDAEDEWNELQAAVDAELARAELLDHRRTARERARTMLGPVDAEADLAMELRALRVPAISIDDAAASLARALVRVGLVLDEDMPEPDTLEMMAETWLAENELAATRRDEAFDELRRLDLDHEEALAQMRELEAAANDHRNVDPDDRRKHRLDEATAGLVAAEARLARHQQSEQDCQRLETELNEAAAAEQEAAGVSSGADRELADATAAVQAADDRIHALEIELDEVRLGHEAAVDELRSLEGGHDVDERATLEQDATARAAAAESARQADATARSSADRAAAELSELDVEIEGLVADVEAAGSGESPAADEVEWYLLARLAAQRSVSYAGSVPLVIDDALAGLEEEEVRHLLDRLERMAAAVQVIYLSDDPTVARWAESAGPDRAAVVTPEPISA
jgi:hypothetical protein